MKNQKTNQIVVLVLSIVLSLGVGFFVGSKFKQDQKPEFTNQFSPRYRDLLGREKQGQDKAGPKGSVMRGSRPVVGEITASDGKSLTVEMNDGSSKIVLVSSSTSITKAQSADTNSLKIGEKISVFGTQNPDGSTTAQSIQLNPLMPNEATTSSIQKK